MASIIEGPLRGAGRTDPAPAAQVRRAAGRDRRVPADRCVRNDGTDSAASKRLRIRHPKNARVPRLGAFAHL